MKDLNLLRELVDGISYEADDDVQACELAIEAGDIERVEKYTKRLHHAKTALKEIKNHILLNTLRDMKVEHETIQ